MTVVLGAAKPANVNFHMNRATIVQRQRKLQMKWNMKIKLTSQLTLADCQRRTQFCFFFFFIFFGYGNGNRGDEHKTILLGRL